MWNLHSILRYRRSRLLFVVWVAIISTIIICTLSPRVDLSPPTPSRTQALISTAVQPGVKYFVENANSSHLDARFSVGTPSHELPQPDALRNLVASFVSTMRDLNVTTWLAHGTLLGWYWGRKFLPWDMDADMHMTLSDLTKLAMEYNMTTHAYGSSKYLLDINPMALAHGESGNQDNTNRIDARWIDMQTGLFADITAVESMQSRGKRKLQLLKANDGHKYLEKHVLPLNKSMFEGFEVYIPHAAEVVLAQEYSNAALSSKVFRG